MRAIVRCGSTASLSEDTFEGGVSGGDGKSEWGRWTEIGYI